MKIEFKVEQWEKAGGTDETPQVDLLAQIQLI